MSHRSTISTVLVLLAAGYCGWEAFNWTVNRVYVEPGQSLMLRYKGAYLFGTRKDPEPGKLADWEKGEVGVL
jgi:hypothetical protein